MIKFFPVILGLPVCTSTGVGNLNSYNEVERWLWKCHKYVEEFPFDSGVHKLFAELGMKDYPRGHILKYYQTSRYLAKRYKDVKFYFVIPDVPSDYDNNPIPDNIEKTIKYIEDYLQHEYLSDLDNAEVIAVVQGKKDIISSVVYTYKRYYDLYKNFKFLGLGPTCSTKSVKKLARLILTFDNVVNKPFHVFGPNLRAIKLVVGKVKRMYSFDSGSFQWIGSRRTTNKSERMMVFIQYIEKVKALGIEVPKII